MDRKTLSRFGRRTKGVTTERFFRTCSLTDDLFVLKKRIKSKAKQSGEVMFLTRPNKAACRSRAPVREVRWPGTGTHTLPRTHAFLYTLFHIVPGLPTRGCRGIRNSLDVYSFGVPRGSRSSNVECETARSCLPRHGLRHPLITVCRRQNRSL
ncbi:hypothetical protein J6590_001129 [Homalodisca vitripennis]|nr:hypothetical protein J6590_001129 [Homalodisca vitripennis]